MRAGDVLRAVLGKKQRFALPRELIGTDRVLQRWAVSVGLGLPSDEWDDTPRAKPPPLPDDVAIIVDQVVLDAPPKTRQLITRWYKSPDPVEALGDRLRISPRSVYRVHAASLYYMRNRLESTGDPTLWQLVRIVDT